MEWNKPFVVLLTLFFSVSVLCAQNVEPGFFIDNTSDPPSIFQRLVWDKDNYVLHYQIVIYFYNERYEIYHDEITENNFLEISLHPGRYRYNVTPYDLLGRRGESSEWKEFIILPAYQPRIERFTPESFFLDQRLERVLNIAGYNLLDVSEIYLRNNWRFLTPIRVDIINNNRARLVFDDELLRTGIYQIYIRNPGGLEAFADGFVVGYRKPLDIFLKTSLSPLIPIYGDFNDYFGTRLYLTGITFALEVISSKRSTFNGGLELAASGYLLNPALTIKSSMYDFFEGFQEIGNGVSFADFSINISLQKRFNHNKIAVTSRFGCGFSLLSSYGDFARNEEGDKARENFSLHLNLGVAGLFYIFDALNIEIGVDFVHHLTANNSGFIRPKLGLAWKF